MALVFDKYNLALNLVDGGGSKSTMNFRLGGPGGLSIDVASVIASNIASEIDAMTTAKIASYSLSTRYVEDTDGLPADGKEIENIAQIQFALEPSAVFDGSVGKYGFLKIPAPVDDLFLGVPGSGEPYNTVDPANPLILAFLDRYHAGIAIDYTLTTSDGQLAKDPTIPGNVKGKRMHRKNRKG